MENLEQIINNLHFTSLFWQVIATLVFMLADIISGLISAVIRNDLDSKVMREGLLRKILLIMVVALSFVISSAFGINIISKVVCIYIIIMEIISILENLKKAGIDLGKLGELLKIKPDEETVNVVVKKDETEVKK